MLIKGEPTWENLFNIAEPTLEREKLYYAKKKAKAENQQYGHILEPVAAFRPKVLARDLFYIFRLNDKNMNSKRTSVFRSSRTQIQLVTEVDRDGTGFLNSEYGFADGIFKRFPGLSPYLYMFMLVFYEK